MRHLWGVDLGGTKIEGVVLHPDEMESPVVRKRIATERAGGYDHILSRISQLVDGLGRESGLQRPDLIGIGTPGIPDPKTGLMKNSNTTCLIGRDLRSDLKRVLGCDIVMQNDANCFALAEALIGAARGYETVFGVILGTGVGGGMVVRGEIACGLHGIAGEWGHNQLVEGGEPCYCGQRGCVETIISGPALERFYEGRSGDKLDLEEVARRDQSGQDPHARETIDRLCAMFGKAIAGVLNVFDPHAIVLGGGVGNIPRLAAEAARSARPYAFNQVLETPFLSPLFGDSAGVLGAALLTWRPS